MSDEITSEQEEREAIARLTGTRDGILIRNYFRRVLESCRVTESSGALHRHEGARILARDFMSFMDAGQPNAGRPDEPILRSSHTGPVGHRTGDARRARIQQLVAAELRLPDPT